MEVIGVKSGLSSVKIQKEFDMTNPEHRPSYVQCPQCKRFMTLSNLVGTEYMPKYKGRLFVYRCPCGATTGLFMEDNPKPDETYIVKKVKR